MGNVAPCVSPISKRLRIVTAIDLHWIKWSFSPDRWGFTLQNRWYLNTLLAYFCSVINAYSRQGQECHGIDVPLDWLLDRCFGATLSRSTLKRALKELEGQFIECPRMRPGNKGKRIIFKAKLSGFCLHGSKRASSGSTKDRKVPSNRRVNTKTLRAKSKRLKPALKSLLIVAEKMGLDELAIKRVYWQAMSEIEKLGTPGEKQNRVDWEYFGARWRGMSFEEREGCARVNILPHFCPTKTKGQKKLKPAIIPDENPTEIRKLILQSLGVSDDN